MAALVGATASGGNVGFSEGVALLLRRGARADADGKPVSDILRRFGYAHEERILRLLDDAYAARGPAGALGDEAV